MRTTPCPTCPWRKSSTVGGFDIPRFDIDLMRGLSNTVGEGDAFRPIMACHYSTCEHEETCIGYAAVEGWSNLVVRMMVIEGKLDLHAITDACADIEMWDSFGEMLAEYEAAAS